MNVALIGERGYGRNIGKKGTESDITFYNVKREKDTVTIIEPNYPEKFASLFYALSIADIVTFVVSKIDAYFGEALIAASMLGIDKAIFVVKNEVKIDAFIEEIEMKKYFFDDAIEIREFLMQMAAKRSAEDKKEGTVAIDSFFNIKGVGTVILGTVVSGSIRKHDDAMLMPLGKRVHIRSIQKHDDDFDIAGKGDRVGIALKNVKADELKRGYVLTTEQLEVRKELELEIQTNKYWRGKIKEGMVTHIGNWMQFIPANVVKEKFILNRPLVFKRGSKFFIAHLDSPIPRIIGMGIAKD